MFLNTWTAFFPSHKLKKVQPDCVALEYRRDVGMKGSANEFNTADM